MSAQLALYGWPEAPSPLLKTAALLSSRAPDWNRDGGTIDSDYWAFGSEAMRSVGGKQAEYWQAAVRKALIPSAEAGKGGQFWSSAPDAWHNEGSEVGMTAMFLLALEGGAGHSGTR